MRKLIEWFFSLLIDNAKVEAFKKEEAEKLRKEYLDYQNAKYLNKLRKNATKKRI